MKDLGRAVHEVGRLVTEVDDADLGRPTPCPQWSVRDLVLHLFGVTVGFTAVARKQAPTTPPPTVLEAGWRVELSAGLTELAAAWRDPAAWEGVGEAGGVRLPQAVLGVVALDELVLHGWDLARALGTPFDVAEADLLACRGFVEQAIEQGLTGPRGGLFGPAVDAGATSELDRLVARAGRDPGWHGAAVP